MRHCFELQDYNIKGMGDRNTSAEGLASPKKSGMMTDDDDECDNAPATTVLSRTCSLFSDFPVSDLDDEYDKAIFANFVVPPKDVSATEPGLDFKIMIPDRRELHMKSSRSPSIVTVDSANQSSKNIERKDLIQATNGKKKQSDISWRANYSTAKAYVEKHGHISRGNRKVANWIKRQRQQYRNRLMGKPSSMTAERIAEMEKLDFEWKPREALWKEKYDALRQFWQKNQHSKLPSIKEFRALHKWCKRQRHGYWAYTMEQQRIEMLDEIEFDWGQPQRLARIETNSSK